MSVYPLAAISRDATGLGLGLDMGRPSLYRLVYHAGTRQLFAVCDFGLADNFQKRPSTKSLSENLESASRNASGESVRLSDDRIGSPGWTSPELCPKSGTKSQPDQVGPPSDVYSIGAILYWLLSGEQPPVPNPIGLTASGRPVFAELQSVPN